MTGPSRGCRVTSLLVVFLGLLFIDRTEGYPYKWPEFFSHDHGREQTPARETSWRSGERHVVTSASSKDYARDNQTSRDVLHQVRSSLTNDRENDGTRVADGGPEERSIRVKSGGKSGGKSSEETETDDENENDGNISDDYNEDDITRLIEQAYNDDVFLTPEKWIETHVIKPLEIPQIEAQTSSTNLFDVGERVIFPDELTNPTSIGAIRRAVPSCKDSTFCVETPYYPSEDEIDKALKFRYLDPVTEPTSISQRTGFMEDDNGLCRTKEEVITPKTGLDDKDEWRYIVNNNNYVQTVRIEICKSRDSPCEIIDNPASGYRTSCKQKYVYRQLVAYDKNGMSSVPFKTPSNCCCHVKFVGNVLERMGVDVSKSNRQSPILNKNKN